jgi:phosphatidylinositol-3-phosphatase
MGALLRAACLTALALLACGSAGVVAAAPAAAATSPCGPSKKVPTYTHVVVIAFENQSYQAVLGSSAPNSYFKTLAGECGVATDFTAAEFPHSLPNYLAVTGGSMGSVTGDCLPSASCSVPGGGIFGQVGPTQWRVWAESMPSACSKANGSTYAARHNPPAYYTGLPAATCQSNDLAMPAPLPAPGRRFTWITPNLNDDATVGTVTDAGTWLQNLLGGAHGLLNSKPYTLGNTAIYIWFDSGADTDSLSTPVPLIVVAPSTGHRVVATHFSDYSLLRGWENMLKLPCLGGACSATGFNQAFRL